MDSMIPEDQCAAVRRALGEAFGVTAFEDISTLPQGFTASLVFRIVVRGSPFVLKIITRPYTLNTMTRHFACMRAAAEAGLAPRVRYSNVEDRTSITDFVEGLPFPLTDALVRVPATLRTLHALPAFSRVEDHLNTSCMFLLNRGPALDGFIRRFQSANILPADEWEEVIARYAQVDAVYPRHHSDFVSSHNDLKPENILFDGHRMWLVDWEAAFLNDRYADLAVAANFVVGNEAEERIYLEEYFGQAPDEYQRARFFLMQQISHLFFAMGYLLIGSAGAPMNLSDPAPDFRDFHRRNWAGKVHMADKQMKVLYGRIHWDRLLRNVRAARFDEALRIVSGGPGSSLA